MLKFDAKIKEKALTQALGKAFLVLIVCLIANTDILFDDVLKFFLLFPAAILFGGWVIYFGENLIFYATTSFLDDDKNYSPTLVSILLLLTKFLCLIYLICLGLWASTILVPDANKGYLALLTIVGWYLCHITYADCKKELFGADNQKQSEIKLKKERVLNLAKFHKFILKTLCSSGFEILYSEVIAPTSYVLTKRNGYSIFILNVFTAPSPDFLKKAIDMACEKTTQTDESPETKYDYSMLIYPRPFPAAIKEYAKGKKIYLIDNEGLKKLIARGKKNA